MKSNYSELGKYIQEINIRNSDLAITNLLGVSMEKTFISSVANLNGVDLSVYKVLRNDQLACKLMSVGRDEKLPVDLYKDENPAIVSSAYYVFEPNDKEELLPEYLMMWLCRPENDRYIGFISGGDVRGGISWETFCSLPIKVPKIDKQREIVKEYNTIQNRIALNQQLIQKLEETAQAIYKQWFVEFEFPDENGKPYKSNCGEMLESELGEIPQGWKTGSLNELVEIIDGDRGTNYPSIEDMLDNGFCLFLNAGNVTKIGFDFSETKFITKEKDEKLRKGKLKRNDIVLTSRGTVGNAAFYSEAILFNHIRINSGMVIMRAKDFTESTIFVYSMLRNSDIKKSIDNYLSGSAQPQLPIKDLIKIPILIPVKNRIIEFSKMAKKLQMLIDRTDIQNQKLTELKELLLSRLAKN